MIESIKSLIELLLEKAPAVEGFLAGIFVLAGVLLIGSMILIYNIVEKFFDTIRSISRNRSDVKIAREKNRYIEAKPNQKDQKEKDLFI